MEDHELEKCTARKGDLLICEGGEAGRAAVWDYPNEICFQNHIHRARFYSEIDPYFAFRFFEKLNYTGEINNFRKGVGITNISSKTLSSIIFPLPPLAEQNVCRKDRSAHGPRDSLETADRRSTEKNPPPRRGAREDVVLRDGRHALTPPPARLLIRISRADRTEVRSASGSHHYAGNKARASRQTILSFQMRATDGCGGHSRKGTVARCTRAR
jgi:hypothetical protein